MFCKEMFCKKTFNKEMFCKEMFCKVTFSKEMFTKETFIKDTFSKKTISKETFCKETFVSTSEFIVCNYQRSTTSVSEIKRLKNRFLKQKQKFRFLAYVTPRVPMGFL